MQPLPQGKSAFLDAGYLQQRPHVAAMLAHTIALWPEIEHWQRNVVASMLGKNAEIALLLYDAIESDGAKRAVFRKIRDLLDIDTRDLVTAVHFVVSSAYDERNKCAHWTWGVSPDYDNALICQNPRDLDRKVYIYREKDFREAIIKLTLAKDISAKLSLLLKPDFPRQASARMRRQLSDEPLVRHALDKIQKNRHKSNSEPRRQ